MSQSPAPHRIRPVRGILLALLTLGLTVVGLPPTSASAAADGVVKGTVSFHEIAPDRTVQVFVQDADGVWGADASRTATVAGSGAYTASVPAGVPVKLRVSFGAPAYGYWYGDVFSVDAAATVTAASGVARRVDLDVPTPVSYSGRLVDRSGAPVAGTVVPTVNTDGASVPIVDAPIPVDSGGAFSVFLPAREGGVYEGGVRGTSESGEESAWLDGGTGWEPDFYLNPHPGDSFSGQVIELPIGQASSSPSTSTPRPVAKLRATRTPVVRGVVRKGHRLHSTRGAYTARPTALRYQWLRNGKAIRGATHASYRLRKADVRKHISVRVTAFRSGTKVRVISPRTAAVRGR